MTNHPNPFRSARDAVSEVRLYRRADFAEALKFVPDEFHGSEHSLEDRFVAAVVRNAVAVGRSPYTVALFALDFA